MIPLYFYDNLKERLSWDNGTPIWLDGKNKGKVAGHISSSGYRRLVSRVNNKRKLITSARLRWYTEHNYLPNIIDHINRDRLDDRIENLRDVNSSQNARNRTPKGTSRYKGVSWSRKMNKWKSAIRNNSSKVIHLGYHQKEKDAAIAYDNAARDLGISEFCTKNLK